MHCKTLFIAIVTVFSLVSFTGMAQDKAVAAAVENLRKQMIDPTQEGLATLAADQISYGHSNGLIEDKKAFIHALVSGENDFKTIELTEQTITVVDNTAMVRHKLSADTNNGGQPGHVKLSVLLIFVKQKNDWKLLARQAVKIP